MRRYCLRYGERGEVLGKMCCDSSGPLDPLYTEVDQETYDAAQTEPAARPVPAEE